MIVCIHGGPGGDYRYLLNCKDLAEKGYRVVFYDQRGSGLSQRFLNSSYSSLGLGSLDVIYDELSGVIAHYRTSPNQKVFLIGHSWGGMLATAYVGKHPDAIQGLVVGEPGGLKWDDVREYITESHSFKLWAEAFNGVTYLDQFITGKEDEHEILDYKASIIFLQNIIGEDSSAEPGSFWRSGAVINSAFLKIGEDYTPDFSEGVSQFTTPVLFLYSEKNQVYTDSWAQKISSAYYSTELFKVMGTGHIGIILDKTAWTQQTLPKILAYFNSL